MEVESSGMTDKREGCPSEKPTIAMWCLLEFTAKRIALELNLSG
jgi:hypothetical protein